MLDPEAFRKLVGLVTQVVAADAEIARRTAAEAEKAVRDAMQTQPAVGRVRPSDWLVQKAMAPELPRITARQWDGLLEVREVLEEGLTEEDPKKLRSIVKRADALVSRLIGTSVIVEGPVHDVCIEPFADHGLEANLTRLFEWIGLSHEEARENAWDLADAIREAEEEKSEGSEGSEHEEHDEQQSN